MPNLPETALSTLMAAGITSCAMPSPAMIAILLLGVAASAISPPTDLYVFWRVSILGKTQIMDVIEYRGEKAHLEKL
jgi:hypothetical protein